MTKMSDTEIQTLLDESNTMATGVTATSQDGRVFFIPDEELSRFEIHPGGLFRMYETMSSKGVGPTPVNPMASCEVMKRYLDSNSPNSETWRRVSLIWADHCL